MMKKNAFPKVSRRRKVLHGQALSSGYAMGKAFVYRDILSRDLLVFELAEDQIPEEMKRIQDAIEFVYKDLQKMKNILSVDISKKYGNIAEAHKMMLKDQAVIEQIDKELKQERLNAEQTVKNVFRQIARRFRESSSDIVASKGDDIDDLCRRIIRVLLGYDKNVLERLPKNSMLVATRLLPSDTVNIKKENVSGIIVEQGTKESHSAILARAIGIPIILCKNIIKTIKKGSILFINAEEDEVVLYPNHADYKNYLSKIDHLKKKDQHNLAKAKSVIKNNRNVPIYVYANSASRYDIHNSVERGCDGIGLLRIEQIYLSVRNMPDKRLLIKELRKIVEPVKDQPITIRLLDIGSDKKLPYLNIEEEINTDLGLRGVRILLKYKNLLRTQIMAILELSRFYDIRILIPMVTLPEEIDTIKDVFKKCADQFCKRKRITKINIKIGAMIETPAAVLNISQIAELCDFLSIGTNDLIQYTMVAGREDPSVAEYFDKGVSVVMPMLKKVIKTAEKRNIECTLCGELASDINRTKELLKIGLKSFSVSPFVIPELKQKIRELM